MQITTSDFRRGLYILFHDEPHQIAEVEFVNPGKGSAFYRTKLRSMRTGRVIDYTFRSGESVEELLAVCAGARTIAGVEGSQLIHGIAVLEEGGNVLALQAPGRFVGDYKHRTDRERHRQSIQPERSRCP